MKRRCISVEVENEVGLHDGSRERALFDIRTIITRSSIGCDKIKGT